MAGGYGNIKPEDGKQFSKDYQPQQKWTEEKAKEVGKNLITWLKEKDENIFYKHFLIIENDYDDDLLTYLSNKFTSFSELLKKAKEIQEIKLVENGVFNNLNPTMSIFTLKNYHNFKDKQEIEQSGEMTVNVIREKLPPINDR